MLRIAVVLLLVCLSAACVTEKSYLDSNKQVKSLEFDKNEAAKAKLLLGLEYLRTQNYPQAKLNLDQALEYAPNKADVHYSLAYYYQTVENYDKAQTSYQIALNLEPNNPDTLNNYAIFLCKTSDLQSAKRYFKQAIKVPNYNKVASSYLNLAHCEIKHNDYNAALNSVTTASKHDPQSSEIILLATTLHYAFSDLRSAHSWFQEYELIKPPNSESLLLGILLARASSNTIKEQQLTSQLIALFPTSEQHQLLASNKLAQSEPEQLKRSVQLSVGNANVISIDTSLANTSTRQDHTTETVRDGIHIFNALKKENLLPEEELIYSASDKEQKQIVERTPWLDIQHQQLKIPTHKVAEGENLYRVSIKFNIQIPTLMKWNKLKKQQVNTGQLLYIRNPDVYYVVNEDKKLSDIADELSINLNHLMQWNHVPHDGIIKSNTQLVTVDPELFK